MLSSDISEPSRTSFFPNNTSLLFVSNLPCMYINARSLNNKLSLLENYVTTNKPMIVAVTETWAKPELPDGLYALPGYQLLRDDRLD